MAKLLTWGIHLLTASGAAFALGAALAAAHGNWQIVFACLGAALIVDGIDGPLARWARVTEQLPWFDGAALDFVVDYSTYVLIPAIIIASGTLLSGPWSAIAGIVIAVVGALYFADKRMKTPELAFRGFPAVWNTVAFVLMVYRPPEMVTLALVALFAALTFSPVEFIHPIRVKRWRPLTLAITIVWAVLAIVVLAADLKPNVWVAVTFGMASFYLAIIGAVLQATRRT